MGREQQTLRHVHEQALGARCQVEVVRAVVDYLARGVMADFEGHQLLPATRGEGEGALQLGAAPPREQGWGHGDALLEGREVAVLGVQLGRHGAQAEGQQKPSEGLKGHRRVSLVRDSVPRFMRPGRQHGV